MTSRSSSKNGRKKKNAGNVDYNIGHILYMTQLTGDFDIKNLITTIPEQDKERYKHAFASCVKGDLLIQIKEGDKKGFFSINPDKDEEIQELIQRFVRGTKEEIKVKQVPRNPFFHRGPVREIDHFVGRGKVITHIFDRLRHTEDCSIIGPRAIGKTSLLHFVSHKEVVRKYHLDPKKILFIYYDLQRFGETAQVKDFFYEMFSRTVSQVNQSELISQDEIRKINNETGNVITKIHKSLLEIGDLEELIGAMCERDFRLVYMFDEFESIALNPSFDFSFYGQLRALSGNPSFKVAFITASKQSIYDLTFTEEVKTSPFFRYFEDFRLGLMNGEETKGFFSLAAKNGFIFSNNIRTLIEQWSGGHPFLIQLACDYFFELAMNQSKLRSGDEERHMKKFLSRHKKHFAYFWMQMDKRQQACLARLANGKVLGSDCKNVLSDLEEGYLVVEKNDEYKIFSKAFERYVRDIPTPKSDLR